MKTMYNLIYRIRKSGSGIRINTRERLFFFDYLNTEDLKEKKILRLQNEFHFQAQSEIRT